MADELRGTVLAIRWRDAETNNVIATLRADGDDKQFTILGHDDTQIVREGNALIVIGEWRTHETRGPQFHASAFVRIQPRTEAGTIRYLREIAGLSDGEARKCWRRWGEKTIDTLRTEPATAAAVLSDVRAGEIAVFLRNNLHLQEARIGLANIFAGQRIPQGTIYHCIDRWGPYAADVVRRDAFILLSLPDRPIGFARADALYLANGGNPGRLKRQTLFLAWAIETNRAGHTWMEAQNLADKLEDYEGIGRLRARPRDAIVLGLRVGLLAGRRDAQQRLWLTTEHRKRDEDQIADRICGLLEGCAAL
jgi:hypothetical protein